MIPCGGIGTPRPAYTEESFVRKLPLTLATIVVLVLVGGGCGGGGGGDEGAATGDGAAAAPDTFDRAFIDGMVPHHRAAIEMAREASEARLSQPDLVRIADAIVRTQQREIDQMLAWREEWYGSAEIDPRGADELGFSKDEMGMSHDASELTSARDVDAAFAAMMIDHHEGAVRMAKLALDRSGRAPLRRLARNIVDAQEREIRVMEKYARDAHDHP